MNSNEKSSKPFPDKEHIFPDKTKQNKLDNNSTKVSFPIIGIGASAGGLDALEKFFKVMPDNSGLAFVVVMHMDPSHKSILPEILQKFTQMQVVQAADNLRVEPNVIYVTPPNCRMSILNGYLFLLEMSLHELTVDIFLRSLAEDQGSNSGCIILSGTGTDGTLGLSSIKAESGLVIVQEEASAKYSGMPQSAINTGLADVILPPEKIPEYLLEFVKYSGKASFREETPEVEDAQGLLKKIFIILRTGTGHDFSMYKKKTIFRRIEKRMLVNKIENISDYILFLQRSRSEPELLFKEFLIGVTSFFRDADAFESLKTNCFPRFFKNYAIGNQVKIWVPGCSTGEEVYSIAIILQEYINEVNVHLDVQIFGTDISEDFITKARTGIYPESIKSDVSSERLNNFFIKKDNKSYQIRKSIREMVVFAPQDIVKDPPFTKLDMLCCRNLLIYFEPELQKKVISSFCYSLNNNGILFLGSSESTCLYPDCFSALDKKWKIYKKLPREKFKHPAINFNYQELTGTPVKRNIEKIYPANRQLEDVSIIKLLKTILSQSDLSPCAAIDIKGNILYIHGSTGRFLEPAQGETCLNILKMARHGLKTGLLNAVNKVKAQRKETIINGLKVKCNGGYVKIDLIVRPLPDFQAEYTGMMLVIFQEYPLPKCRIKAKTISLSGNDERKESIKDLEEELMFTKEKLLSTTMELETYNEELRSANEELQSTNEELQSTNEELETSKEELQSLNEESNTLNSELQSRIDKLTTANDDIKNLLDATEIASVFLNIDLKVRRFTPSVTVIFPLLETDIDRPITDISSSLIDVDLHTYAEKVLKDLAVQEMESESRDGKIYRVRVKPYRTANNVIDGVVITFEDITKLKRFEIQIKELSSSFEKKLLMMSKVFMESADPVIIEDLKGVIMEANNAAVSFYGKSREELLGSSSELLLSQEDKDLYRKTVEECRVKGAPIRNFKGRRINCKGEEVDVVLTFTPIFDLEGGICAIATIVKKSEECQ